MLWGSACVKAARRMLMKLTPGTVFSHYYSYNRYFLSLSSIDWPYFFTPLLAWGAWQQGTPIFTHTHEQILTLVLTTGYQDKLLQNLVTIGSCCCWQKNLENIYFSSLVLFYMAFLKLSYLNFFMKYFVN